MNDNAKLPKTAEDLESIISDAIAPYESKIEYLQDRIKILEKIIFGPRSEKRHPHDGEGGSQLHLFNEAEVLEEKKKEESLTVPEHTRKKPKRKPLPDNLPRVDIIHDIDESEKICGCGVERFKIGEEISEKLDITPAKIQVIRHIRYKYACKNKNCEGVESEGPAVVTAPLPPQIIPKGMATPGLLAYIAVSKYLDSIPLYRQENIFERLGIEISRSTMAGWMVMAAQSCDPVMDLLYKQLQTGPLINIDETPVQVLKEPGRENTTKSYMWVFRGGIPEKPVVIFRYSPTRSGEVPREALRGYQGYCQTDGYSGYDGLESLGIRLVGCFFHVRRNFVKVIDARGKKGKGKTGSAEVALGYIGQLYKVEKEARARGLSPPEIVQLRMEKAKPVLEEFKAWLEKKKDQTPPKGLLGMAVEYALTRWPKLIRYLENGYISPDNNAVENAIRPFALGRKNWLFAGSPAGADAAATLYSLIQTAKACGLDPYQYLRFLFEKLPYASTEADYLALLPQNVILVP